MALGIGIAGYGRRGKYHARALAQVPNAVVAAVADISQASLETAATDLPGAATYTSASHMSAADEVDAVIIAAPAELNGAVAEQLVGFGKPLLIEKPPAMSTAELRSLADAAERAECRVMVAFNRRFNPLVRQAIAAVREAGDIVQIVGEFHKDIHDFTDDPRFSGDILDHMLLESPIHTVDLLAHIADAPPERTTSVVRRAISPHRDVHAALIEFANGIVGQFTSAYTAGGRLERYAIHGEYVSAYLEGVNSGWLLRENQRTELPAPDVPMADTVAQDAEFVEAVLQGRTFCGHAATLETSMATLELCEAILAGTR